MLKLNSSDTLALPTFELNLPWSSSVCIMTIVEFAKEMDKVAVNAMTKILVPLIVAMLCRELVSTNPLSAHPTTTCALVTFGNLFFSLTKSVNGQCPYPVIPCDDGNSCTNSACHPLLGCSHSPVCPKVI